MQVGGYFAWLSSKHQETKNEKVCFVKVSQWTTIALSLKLCSSSDYVDSSDEEDYRKASVYYSTSLAEGKRDDKTKKKQQKGGTKQSDQVNPKPSGENGGQGTSQDSGKSSDKAQK